jgi:hypothetical protein
VTRNLRSAFHKLQQRAHRVLTDLGREIRSREAELRRLKEEASKLKLLASRLRAVGAAHRANRPARRINWRALVAQLPRRFSARDVRSMRELRSKAPSEIFAGIARWIDLGLVKRKARGSYERVR